MTLKTRLQSQHGDNQEEGKIEVAVIKPKRELRKKDEPPKLHTN